ncbi:hypothetical protein BH20ACT15_BH20ACT15_06050 [soil metagenome]
MRATIYGVIPSPPSHAARLMAERKGIDHKMVWLLPGLHPAAIRARRFRGSTVPAMKLGRKRYQHSREISRALEDSAPEPRLFPESPRMRLEVEEAERWGEEVLQGAPRRIYRWVASNRSELRVQLAGELGMPVPAVAGRLNTPVAKLMARKSGATDQRTQATLALLPALLDRVEQLISQNVIGDVAEPNAADLQIVTSLRSLLTHEDIIERVGGRPAAKWALKLMPDYPGVVPPLLPEAWLEPLSA